MELKVSSPCPLSWDSLVGDDRLRYCGQCRLNVYNLAILSPGELEELVRKTEGRLCGRLYVRDDRTATVRECSGSVARKRMRAALALVAGLLLGGLVWLCFTVEPPDRVRYPSWVRAVLEWIHPTPQEPPPRELMGKIACPKD